MSLYNTGTVTTTAGSNVVTGLNTLWSANVAAGDYILIGSVKALFEIATVDSDTQLTLTANFPSALDGQTYEIYQDFTANKSLPLIPYNTVNLPALLNRTLREIDGYLQFGMVRHSQYLVDDRAVDAPPGAPTDGYTVIVGASPSGAFVGHEQEIAVWDDGESEWVFYEPDEDTTDEYQCYVYVKDEEKLYFYDATDDAWYALTMDAYPSVRAGTRIYLDAPTNTAWIEFNSTTGMIEVYRDSVLQIAF